MGSLLSRSVEIKMAGKVGNENDINLANHNYGMEGEGNFEKLPAEERKKLRRSYKKLMETTADFDATVDVNDINKRSFAKTLKETKKLFKMVDSPQEAVLDAQVFKHLSRLTRAQVEGLSTNSQKFNPSEFFFLFMKEY